MKSTQKKYAWVSAAGIGLVFLLALIVNTARPEPTVMHGVSEEAVFELSSYVHGDTLEMSWTEIPGADGYIVHFNSTQLTIVESNSLSLTPYQDGFYTVSTASPLQALQSNVIEARHR